MRNKAFSTADILLPLEAAPEKWSVIACDQFTSEPEYWRRVEERVSESPSTLRMILPEAWLDRDGAGADIESTMRGYLNDGVFRRLDDSLIYVERRTESGVRKGLLAAVDLEQYDYRPGSASLIRCTEGTVESRLPARVAVRRRAPLELPHVIVFIDDPSLGIIEAAGSEAKAAPALYDFELMEDGGRLSGWRVHGDSAARALNALDALTESGAGFFAVGDGNHSLAAAKLWWDELRPTLSEIERENHPARFALTELVNLHDAAMLIEPIHRVISGVDVLRFREAALDFFEKAGMDSARIVLTLGGESYSIFSSAATIGGLIAEADAFLAGYIDGHGGTVDYVHDADNALTLAARPGCAALLLPALRKGDIFRSIAEVGPFPRKSFSVGHAREKRYYMECREITLKK